MNPRNYNPRPTGRILAATFVFTSLLAACGSDAQSDDTTTAPAGGSIAASSIWARTSPVVAKAGAVYMTLDNTTGVDDALVGVRVDPSVAETAELHETVAVETDASSPTMTGAMDAGEPVMEMRPVDRIVVPANGSVALAPGGYHIMLMELVSPLTVGSTVPLTLTFENAGEQDVIANVRDAAP